MPYGIPHSRIDEVLRIVDLTNTGKKRAGQFSLGMKQRLGIAIALLNYPKLLILDEPTNGLDPIGIQELRKLIRSFPEQGITVILSSHLLAEVEQVVDKIGIIAGGKLGYQGIAPQGQELESLFMQVAAPTERRANNMLLPIMRAESLKWKRTFIPKLIWLTPILHCFLLPV